MEFLNKLPHELHWNVIKYLSHPTTELVKPFFCQTCYKQKLKCYKCDVPICFSCEECGSITSCMYCSKCFEYYTQLLHEPNLIIIHNITHIININIVN